LCIGTCEIDIRKIDIEEVGVVYIGTMIIAFWLEHPNKAKGMNSTNYPSKVLPVSKGKK
jgi:hypothetical protein